MTTPTRILCLHWWIRRLLVTRENECEQCRSHACFMSMGEFDAGKMRSEIHEKMGLWRVCTSDVQTQHMHGHTRGAPVPGAAVSGAPAPGATEMVGQIWMEARRRREAKLMKLMRVKKHIQTHTHSHCLCPHPCFCLRLHTCLCFCISFWHCLSLCCPPVSLSATCLHARKPQPTSQASKQPASKANHPASQP